MAQKSKNLVNSIDLKNLTLHDTSDYRFEFSNDNRYNLGKKMEDIESIYGHKSTEITKLYANFGQSTIKKITPR